MGSDYVIKIKVGSGGGGVPWGEAFLSERFLYTVCRILLFVPQLLYRIGTTLQYSLMNSTVLMV